MSCSCFSLLLMQANAARFLARCLLKILVPTHIISPLFFCSRQPTCMSPDSLRKNHAGPSLRYFGSLPKQTPTVLKQFELIIGDPFFKYSTFLIRGFFSSCTCLISLSSFIYLYNLLERIVRSI